MCSPPFWFHHVLSGSGSTYEELRYRRRRDPVKALQFITIIQSIQKCKLSLQAGQVKRFKSSMISRPHTLTKSVGSKTDGDTG